MVNFDLQQHLVQMEERIREDIAAVGAQATEAAKVANLAKLDAVALQGRVANLEEKAGWIGAGFGATCLAAVGFIWHIVVGPH